MNNFSQNTEEPDQSRFCALAYRVPEYRGTPSREQKVIVLLVEDDGSVNVFVDPNWQEVTETSDHDYIYAILADFKNRAKIDAKALFQQASSLSVGSLVTSEVGTFQLNDPGWTDLLGRMVEVD